MPTDQIGKNNVAGERWNFGETIGCLMKLPKHWVLLKAQSASG